MSITKTLYTGVSGLKAHSDALGVVGDNIANVNTTGYKAERAIFSDLLGRSIAAIDEPGSGVRMSKITRTFSQGTLLNTDSPTDLAINGKGFFIVSGQTGSQTGSFFTRAGQFSLDNDGYVVNPQGYVLQGYVVNSAGEIDNQLTDLQIANSVLEPNPSTTVEMAANLDSTATILTAAWDTTNPGTTSNFSTAITVYDSLGDAHRLDVYFRKTAAGPPANWDYHVLVDGGEIGGVAGVAQEVATGTLGFDANGLLDTEVPSLAWSATFDGAAAQVISFNYGDSLTTDGGTGEGTTHYAASSNIRNQDQDGYSTGELAGLGVQGNGDVMTIYTNGEQHIAGRVAIATFEAEEEMGRAGDNLWIQTQDSGNARIGSASSGSAGSITAGALEQSTVDLANEFVNLISYQRGFQANSRTITTSDQLYQELVNLKR